MRTLIIILVVAISIASCKNDVKTTEDSVQKTAVDSIPTLRGEFIYIADAAVLKGDNFIYGVKIDAKAEELAKRVEPMKREDFDMVPVVVRAKITPNDDQEGWEEIIEIREIISVSQPTAEPAVKVQSNEQKEN